MTLAEHANTGPGRVPTNPADTRCPLGQSLVERVVASPRADRHVTIAPLDGKPLLSVPLSSERDVETAFAEARRAQRVWSRTSMSTRRAIMLRLHDLVLEHREEALDLCQWETGKARKDALEEVLDIAITARHYAMAAPSALKPRRVRSGFPVLVGASVHHHPKGVVGIIAPWNYPLTLAVSDSIPALMAGNGIVHKPDWQTTGTAMWAVSMMRRAGIPDGLVQVVAGDGPVVGPWVVDRADFIMFTGSTRVGRQIAARAGERLIGCSLELGGKNAMIVCADADIEKAADIAVRGSFSNSGQLCIGMERVYVAAEIHDDFLFRFAVRTEAMEISPRIGWGADMGSLISQAQLDRVLSHLENARDLGATVVSGGRHRPDIGPFVLEPTILAGVTEEMLVCSAETFGPVVSVYPFASEDEAVALANETPYGLNACVVSRDARRARDIGARLRAGTVNINEAYGAAWSSLAGPMGGWGDSGLGRRHGTEGLLKYTEAQTIATMRHLGLGPRFGMSHEQWGNTLARATAVLKTLRMK